MLRVIFDTETTGLVRAAATPIDKQPHVIELYALLVDGPKLKKVDEFHSLVNPGQKLSEEITKITKIDDAMLKGQPRWAKIHDDVVKFFKPAMMAAGHNLTFDMDMLNLETKRIAIQEAINAQKKKGSVTLAPAVFPWPKFRLCTVEATEHLLGRRMKLAELHQHLLGEGFDGAHRAKADVDALHACMIELVKRGEIQ